MVERTARLVNEEGYSGYDFLVLTFTRKAAQNMRTKLLSQIPQSEVYKMRIGTFHSQSLRMLREWGSILGYRDGIVVYDPADQKDIYESVVKAFRLKCKWSQFEKWYQAWSSGSPIDWENRDLELAWKEYRSRLKMNNALDFGLILTEAIELLKDPKCYEHYHRKFKFIMVDEYQDTDYTQYALHRMLKPKNLFVVGDPDQNIYHWRGSAIDIILGFIERDYPDGEIITLSENYRSVVGIVEAANNVISFNTDRFAKTLIPTRIDFTIGRHITHVSSQDRDTESETIAIMIRDDIRLYGSKPEQIAVLARTNKQLWDLKQEFQNMDIPFRIITSKGMFWSDHYVRNLTAMLRLAHDIRDEESLYRMLKFPEQIISDAKIKGARKYALLNDCTMFEAIDKMDEVGGQAKQFIEVVKRLNVIAPTTHVIDIFQEAVKLFKIREFAEGAELTHRLELIDEYAEEIESWSVRETLGKSEYDEPLHDFLAWTATRQLQDYIDETDNTVKIMTIHAAKGLEWKTVYLIGCVEGLLPSREDEIEEERRLFYVAITRAMDRLVLSYYYADTNQYSGEAIERTPSRYLDELKQGRSERTE